MSETMMRPRLPRQRLDGQARRAPLGRAVVTLTMYLLVNLVVAVLWHLVLFRETLAAATPFARTEPIMPLGMSAMLVQGILLIGLYPRFHAPGSPVSSGLRFGAVAGLFLATGAIWVEVGKFQFASAVTYLSLETVYEVLSFALLGVVIAMRFEPAQRHEPAEPHEPTPQRDPTEPKAEGTSTSTPEVTS